MADRDEDHEEEDDLEARFLAHLRVITHLAESVGRRQGLRGDDLDDFVAWVKARFIENRYALLAKVRDLNAIVGYLAVVVANLGREHRIQRCGRWRPSAAARRLGPVTVLLERLVYRDGMRLDEAAQWMRTAGLTTLSDRALAELLAQCPLRAPCPARPANTDTPVNPDVIPSPGKGADDRVTEQEDEDLRRSIGERLEVALRALSAEDQLIVRMRYENGMSLADVARALRLPQKPLYRRLERILVGLRAALERDGVNRDDIQALLSEPRPPDPDDPDDRDDPDGPALPAVLPSHAPRPPPATERLGDVRLPPDGDF